LPPAALAGALHEAVKRGDVAAMAAALDGGADINENAERATPLYLAATRGYLDAARLLVNRGADVNLSASFGTPLYAAAKFGHADIVALLLDSGATPNLATDSPSPLHAAADDGCLACVILLVEAGADVDALTPDREPAIHFAKRNGHAAVVAYLREQGASLPPARPIAALLASAEPAAGAALYRRNCQCCHYSLTAENGTIGPHLWNVIGRRKTALARFSYSPAMREERGVWTYEDLSRYLSDPYRTVPGTSMNFSGLQDDRQLADVIAYLRTFSHRPVPLPGR
jgi:cytochrome c